MEQHAMVVPFPAQSHMNALLDFAKLLGSRGFIITFVNTEHMHHRIFKSTQHVAAAIKRLHKRGLRFRFEFVADGLPVDHHRPGGQLIRSLQSWGPALEEFVLRVEREGPPITCIVADAFMSTPAHHLCQKLRLPRVVFWPLSAAASVAQCHTRLLLSKGYLPFKSGEAAYNVIDCLPGIPPVVRPVDLAMSHLTEEEYELFVEESDFQNKGDWVVVNSFEELEGAETMRGLPVNCPALTVGPVFEDQQRQINTTETSLWKEDEFVEGRRGMPEMVGQARPCLSSLRFFRQRCGAIGRSSAGDSAGSGCGVEPPARGFGSQICWRISDTQRLEFDSGKYMLGSPHDRMAGAG